VCRARISDARHASIGEVREYGRHNVSECFSNCSTSDAPGIGPSSVRNSVAFSAAFAVPTQPLQADPNGQPLCKSHGSRSDRPIEQPKESARNALALSAQGSAA
jgi:hypothetical protein